MAWGDDSLRYVGLELANQRKLYGREDGGNGLRSRFCCRTSEMSDQATMEGAFCPALSFVVRIVSSESVRFVV